MEFHWNFLSVTLLRGRDFHWFFFFSADAHHGDQPSSWADDFSAFLQRTMADFGGSKVKDYLAMLEKKKRKERGKFRAFFSSRCARVWINRAWKGEKNTEKEKFQQFCLVMELKLMEGRLKVPQLSRLECCPVIEAFLRCQYRFSNCVCFLFAPPFSRHSRVASWTARTIATSPWNWRKRKIWNLSSFENW